MKRGTTKLLDPGSGEMRCLVCNSTWTASRRSNIAGGEFYRGSWVCPWRENHRKNNNQKETTAVDDGEKQNANEPVAGADESAEHKEPTWTKADLVAHIRDFAEAEEESIDWDSSWARYSQREANDLWDLAYTIELLPDNDERLRRLAKAYPDDVANLDDLLDAGPGAGDEPAYPPLVEELELDVKADSPGGELRHAAARFQEARDALKDVKSEHATHRDFNKALTGLRALVNDAMTILDRHSAS
jgi:hypothetical protein